jgi:uncharacterized protein (TIGR03067 family)
MRLPTLRLTGRRLRIGAAMALTLTVVLYFWAWIPRGDAAKLQGSWRVVAIEDSGVAVNEPFLQTRQYLFDGHRLIVRARGEPVVGSWVGDWIGRTIKSPSFRLDPTASPKAIDLLLPDFSTMRGIYDLEGDRLKICFSGPSGQAAMTRPTGFSVPGSGARLLILERDGK